MPQASRSEVGSWSVVRRGTCVARPFSRGWLPRLFVWLAGGGGRLGLLARKRAHVERLRERLYECAGHRTPKSRRDLPAGQAMLHNIHTLSRRSRGRGRGLDLAQILLPARRDLRRGEADEEHGSGWTR